MVALVVWDSTGTPNNPFTISWSIHMLKCWTSQFLRYARARSNWLSQPSNWVPFAVQVGGNHQSQMMAGPIACCFFFNHFNAKQNATNNSPGLQIWSQESQPKMCWSTTGGSSFHRSRNRWDSPTQRHGLCYQTKAPWGRALRFRASQSLGRRFGGSFQTAAFFLNTSRNWCYFSPFDIISV